MNSKIKLSAFADEYSSAFQEQIQILKQEGIKYLEIRNVDGENVASITLEKAKEIKARLDENNLKVSSIGSPLGKIDITDDFDEHLKVARHIFEIAKILDCQYVRMFSFYNRYNVEYDIYEKEVFVRLEKLLDLADSYQLTLCHENEAGIYGDTDKNCFKLLSHFSKRLKAVFDMGNFVLEGCDPIKAYPLLKDYIEYFHIKDSLFEGAIVPANKGEARIKEVLSLALKDQNKDFFITIEPHLESFDGFNSLTNVKYQNPYKFKTQQEAFLAGVNSTKEILNSLESFKVGIKDKLLVKAFPTRVKMGEDAAKDISMCLKTLLVQKEELNVVFAAAPSQNDVLKALVEDKTIDWNRINAYHMDEYIGLELNAPQRFSAYLNEHIFGLVNFKSINLIGTTDIKEYGKFLKNNIDVVILGIGENGHIAFNDPGVADFNDKEDIKAVELDEMCRNQQVHDGCFPSLDKVPTHAVTLTIPTMFSGRYLFCVVPTTNKSEAVKNTLYGEINESCPASILRKHDNATMYLDYDSASLIKL